MELKLRNDFVTFPFIENWWCISHQDEDVTHFSECQNLENKSSQPETLVQKERYQVATELQFTLCERMISLVSAGLHSQV